MSRKPLILLAFFIMSYCYTQNHRINTVIADLKNYFCNSITTWFPTSLVLYSQQVEPDQQVEPMQQVQSTGRGEPIQNEPVQGDPVQGNPVQGDPVQHVEREQQAKSVQQVTSMQQSTLGVSTPSTGKNSGSESNENKLVTKYNEWREVISNNSSVMRIFEFFGENPHFPLFKSTVKNAERRIKDDLSITNAKLIQWFKKYPPMTREGIEAYIEALLRTDTKTAEKYIQQTYVFQNLEPSYATDFRKKYGEYISVVNDAQRAKRLATQNDIKQLLEMKNAINEKSIIQYVNDKVNNNIEFNNNMLFDASERYKYIEHLINQEKDLDVANVLNVTNYGEDGLFLNRKYFEKRRYVAYNILRAGKPDLAYSVASKYPKNIDDDNKARMEWLLGFISYRFLGKLQQARNHFEEAYKYSQKAVRKSKNAFWLAELYREQADIVAAVEWYRKASEYFSTFYGYLADVRINQLSGAYNTSMDNATVSKVPEKLKEKFYNRELVQILIATRNTEQDKQYRKYFYNKLIEQIEDPYEEILLLELAKANNEVETLIEKFYNKQHYMIYTSYDEIAEEKLAPVTNINSENCFISTVHSVIKQESNFKRRAVSTAGAVGLMQLMPKTAEAEAKILGVKYNKKNLYNEYDNLQLGSSLLNRLMQKYNNNLVFVFYAYNAGEANLGKYRKSIQNLSNISILETIELIPIKETRLYIKNVLRNMFHYHQRFGCEKQSQLIDDILNRTQHT